MRTPVKTLRKKAPQKKTEPQPLQQRQADINKLRPDPRNARHHTDEQIAAIAKSIQRFGFTSPVLVTSRGVIVAGEGRWRAAVSLGMRKLPTLVAPKGWSVDDTRAYAIADNQLGDSSTWNDDILREELRELSDAGYDLDAIGFGADELEKLLAAPPGAPEDFPGFDESIATEHQCPKCGYKWSGQSEAQE